MTVCEIVHRCLIPMMNNFTNRLFFYFLKNNDNLTLLTLCHVKDVCANKMNIYI